MRIPGFRTPALAAGLLGMAAVLSTCGMVRVPTLVPVARPVPPAAPVDLQVVDQSDRALPINSWTNSANLRLLAELPPSHPGPLLPEVEFLPVDQPFTGTPNLSGDADQRDVRVPAIMAGERYHWRIRARDETGTAGPWSEFAGTIGYQPNPPDPVTLRPLPRDGLVNRRQVTVQWDAPRTSAGIVGFGYSLDDKPNGDPPRTIDLDQPAVSVTTPTDGDWFVHVRARDGAGNWSAAATVAIHVDTVPPKVQDLSYSEEGSFNVAMGPLTITANLSEPAAITAAVLPAKDDTPLRTFNLGVLDKQVSFAWDGKDASGAAVPAGKYRLRLAAVDRAGNTGQLTDDALTVTNKRIVISLTQQKLVAYQGDQLFLDTVVTTGGPQLPTPTGTFHVLARYTPFTFKSPWPKGSPFWYADSPSTYAILYDDSGYFIHDAPWRSWFGPGSNARQGKPGQDGTGTHGCTNVPFGAEAKLFPWTEVGTPVIVQS